jgi:hypothetical protein
MSSTQNNGTLQPLRFAPEGGNPRFAAYQSGLNTSNKLNNLNNSTGGGNIQVSTIKPIYTSTFAGSQDPQNQQINNAAISNKAFVQSQGDNVPLVTGGKKRKTGRKHSKKHSKKHNKKHSRKSGKNHSRNLRRKPSRKNKKKSKRN